MSRHEPEPDWQAHSAALASWWRREAAAMDSATSETGQAIRGTLRLCAEQVASAQCPLPALPDDWMNLMPSGHAKCQDWPFGCGAYSRQPGGKATPAILRHRPGCPAEAARLAEEAALPRDRHTYEGTACRHPDCFPEPQGWQAACCGHYYPRSRVLIDADSEPYCRAGMGCQARRPART
jgi:hypothetical protein